MITSEGKKEMAKLIWPQQDSGWPFGDSMKKIGSLSARKLLGCMEYDDMGQHYVIPEDWYAYCYRCDAFLTDSEKAYVVYQHEGDGSETAMIELECEQCRAKKKVKDAI